MAEVSQTVHPWVAERRNRISFALQVEAHRDDPAPGERVIAAGCLAEELGFDAFLAADHPSWQSEPWLHLAALAVTTERTCRSPPSPGRRDRALRRDVHAGAILSDDRRAGKQGLTHGAKAPAFVRSTTRIWKAR